MRSLSTVCTAQKDVYFTDLKHNIQKILSDLELGESEEMVSEIKNIDPCEVNTEVVQDKGWWERMVPEGRKSDPDLSVEGESGGTESVLLGLEEGLTWKAVAMSPDIPIETTILTPLNDWWSQVTFRAPPMMMTAEGLGESWERPPERTTSISAYMADPGAGKVIEDLIKYLQTSTNPPVKTYFGFQRKRSSSH